MKLLIAEKPSVAKSYKQLLEKTENEKFTQKDGYLEGKEYCISWCVGHLVGLSLPAAYGWGWKMENLPMIPDKWKYEILTPTQKQFGILSQLIKKADEVINGTDAGREGELIYRLVMMMSGANDKPQKRLWLNSYVLKDMQKSWKELKPASAYQNLFFSSVVRQKADWLVGMNLSTGYALSTKIKNLSVGRVQTPTLALVVERDREVENWKDKFYYQLACKWNDIEFLYQKDGETKFDKSEDLEKIKEECEGKEGTIVNVEKKDKTAFPPRPFDLASLQKEANVRYRIKAADTLKIAQSLYEKKLVTYPRTDSSYLPENLKDEAYATMEKLITEEQKTHIRPKQEKFIFFNSAKVTDHYAIIPTGEMGGVEALNPNEKKVYNLIKLRFITSFGKPKKWEEINLLMDCSSHSFKSRVNKTVDPGFTAIMSDVKKDDEKEEEKENRVDAAFNVKEGDKNPCREFEVQKKEVTKPKHYTEATLISAMETAGKKVENEDLREAMKERGLGTPATKAQIIEVLKTREYIFEQDKFLISSSKGRQLIDLIDSRVKSPEMTGEWEYKLGLIEKGQYQWKDFMCEIENYVRQMKDVYAGIKNSGVDYSIYSGGGPVCPKCKTGSIKKLPMGWFCSEKKEKCGFVLWTTVSGKKLTDKMLEQLLSKGETGVLKGFKSKAGKSFSAKLKLDQDYKMTFEFDNAPNGDEGKQSKETALQCPQCKEGHIILNDKGAFCSAGREKCTFAVWRQVASLSLSDQQIEELIIKGITGKIDGFKSKAGKLFNAKLKLEENKVKFDFS